MNERSLTRCVAVGLVCLVLATSARGQSAAIGMTVNNGVQSSCYVTLIPGIHTLTIRLDGTVAPVKTARFKIESDCPVTFYGTPANQEYDLTFPACLVAGDEIENFGILVEGSTQICTIRVVPATGHSGIELTDCDGYAMAGIWTNAGPYCSDVRDILAPYRPDPPIGATGVPTNAKLSYIGPANVVLFGTTPLLSPDDLDQTLCTGNPYFPSEPACTAPPLDPGLLAPFTTYYWRAGNSCFTCPHGEGLMSELFSFTTGAGPVAVEPATWGSVKALYRE